MKKSFSSSVIFFIITLALVTPLSYVHADTYPQRVNIDSSGSQSSGGLTGSPHISGDGRLVTFMSVAPDLVSNDTNGTRDIFVRDVLSGSTVRVSVASDSSQTAGLVQFPKISANGRFIVFTSDASDLVPNDTNNAQDVFIRDLVTGSTTRVSIATDGTEANLGSNLPVISADGRYVAFSSLASNLVPNDSNSASDVFVHDMVLGTTVRASVASDGTEGDSNLANISGDLPSISADGRYVVFRSFSDNLVPNDTNNAYDLFEHDMLTGSTTRISVASDGTEANGSSAARTALSDDGRYVFFGSTATNLVPGTVSLLGQIYVHDLVTGTTMTAIHTLDGGSPGAFGPAVSVSGDGRFITFTSRNTNLVSTVTDGLDHIFVYDRQTDVSSVVDVASDGTLGNKNALVGIQGEVPPTISQDGKYIAFDSAASNLVPNDTNGTPDIFIARNPLIPTNQAPILSPIGNKTVDEGQLLQFSVTATDPDNNNLTYSASNLPAGATFDPQTHVFSWKPTFSQSGSYTNITFVVMDDGNPVASTTESIVINVNDVPPLTLATDADSFLRQSSSQRNEGANPVLVVRNAGNNRAVVDFASSTIQNYITQHGISSATLTLTIASNGNNWGKSGRTIDVVALLQSFAEGNGKDFGLPNSESTRGTGSGVTWDCSVDTAIQNQVSNCATQWNGGSFTAPTASSTLIVNNQTGQVSWDVTHDVLNGAYSWLIKKTNEAQAGEVDFYSREGAVSAGNPALTAQLVLHP